ncbi:hypothetical protein TSAR_011944 [Trichomalopsis sarcophagae]|uniref:Uncharacterized protein n=1 Tax=Trichomalopsis sarcophagae TaxID=543379 RepID=A0A232EU93_9HYME|nr:hypothetical protein TSAR_011944 [Trichomalopsis sarcophagae]
MAGGASGKFDGSPRTRMRPPTPAIRGKRLRTFKPLLANVLNSTDTLRTLTAVEDEARVGIASTQSRVMSAALSLERVIPPAVNGDYKPLSESGAAVRSTVLGHDDDDDDDEENSLEWL